MGSWVLSMCTESGPDVADCEQQHARLDEHAVKLRPQTIALAWYDGHINVNSTHLSVTGPCPEGGMLVEEGASAWVPNTLVAGLSIVRGTTTVS